MVNNFLIGISGGSCSGKTTFAKKLASLICNNSPALGVRIISEDDYYHDRETLNDIEFYDGIFDDPIIRDHDLLLANLAQLACGQSVEIPQYDFVHHRRGDSLQTIHPANIIILEGLHIFCNDALVEKIDFKVFIELEDETRLSRRLTRDINERGRDEASVLSQYNGVRHAYDKFIEPIKTRADIITRGDFNDEMLQNIYQLIRNRINKTENHL